MSNGVLLKLISLNLYVTVTWSLVFSYVLIFLDSLYRRRLFLSLVFFLSLLGWFLHLPHLIGRQELTFALDFCDDHGLIEWCLRVFIFSAGSEIKTDDPVQVSFFLLD